MTNRAVCDICESVIYEHNRDDCASNIVYEMNDLSINHLCSNCHKKLENKIRELQKALKE